MRSDSNQPTRAPTCGSLKSKRPQSRPGASWETCSPLDGSKFRFIDGKALFKVNSSQILKINLPNRCAAMGLPKWWRDNGSIGRAGTVSIAHRGARGWPLCWKRVMFWVTLVLALALMALLFAFIWFVDQFADRVKHMSPSSHPCKRAHP